TIIFFFITSAHSDFYTLSLHDALPISAGSPSASTAVSLIRPPATLSTPIPSALWPRSKTKPEGTCKAKNYWKSCSSVATMRLVRSEEHTSELQSLAYLVCRLLLEKKKI